MASCAMMEIDVFVDVVFKLKYVATQQCFQGVNGIIPRLLCGCLLLPLHLKSYNLYKLP